MEFSATHVINVPELRYKIFAELSLQSVTFDWQARVDYKAERENRLTLLAAATSCKTLSAVALDVLWEGIDSLDPLLSIIGIREKELLDGRKSYTLPSAGIDSVQWSKMMCYSNRIRHLTLDEESPVDDFTYFHLSTLLKGNPLTPRLRSLSAEWTPSLTIYMTPTLKSLRIYGSKPELEHFPEFLGMLHKLVPFLEDLEFFRYPVEWGSVYELLGQFKHLHSLQWSEVGMDTGVLSGIEQIFSLPLLTEISLPLTEWGEKILPAMGAFSSINLRNLSITRGSSTVIGDILDCLRHIPLTFLHICYSDLNPLQEYPLVTQTWMLRLAHLSPWADSIHTLELLDKVPMANQDLYGITQEISLLKPLLDFHLLKDLYLHSQLNFDLSDEAFRLIAIAWPNIESLTLDNLHDVPSTQATFASLQSFAFYCPKLQRISINLDIFALPASFLVGNHRLRSIRLVSTCRAQQDENILQTARYLDGAFPSLLTISGCGSAYDTLWRKVNKALQICQAVRADERARHISWD